MTNQEILEKAIQKACKGGFKAEPADFKIDDRLIEWEVATDVKITIGYEVLIYMHDFAKALWGEEWIDTGMPDGATWQEVNIEQLAWQYHLQQMVIADDPIKYLGENL